MVFLSKIYPYYVTDAITLHCLSKKIFPSKESDTKTKILQSLYLACKVGIISSYSNIINCIVVWCFWSDKLLTAIGMKLERLKFAILFTIADMCWVKNKINASYQRMQNMRNINFIHLLFTPFLSFTLGWNIRLVKKQCLKLCFIAFSLQISGIFFDPFVSTH